MVELARQIIVIKIMQENKLVAKIINMEQWRLHKESPWRYLHPHQLERLRQEFKQDTRKFKGYFKRLQAEKRAEGSNLD